MQYERHELKLYCSSHPPATFPGWFSFPVWAVLLACFQGSMKHATLLDNRQTRIRCFVVTHMPKTKDKRRLVSSLLLSIDLPHKESEFEVKWKPQGSPKLFLCPWNTWWERCDIALSRGTVLMQLWTWARGRNAVRQPLVRSFSLQSSRQAGCIPERQVISCQTWETLSEAVQPVLCRSAD